tara:strand:- start:284 stop:703 length:420 start_codon:yes stop_codon:yes gene_type:complete
MSTNWVKDINEMHKKFGVHDWMKNELKNNEWSRLQKFLNFRMKMVQEEVDETNEAIEHKDPEEIVDGLIDMCVFAIGTLDAFGIDANKAWDQIYNANMMKEVGVKEGRPNPLGLPDLIKPDNWENPSHEGNHGSLHNAL